MAAADPFPFVLLASLLHDVGKLWQRTGERKDANAQTAARACKVLPFLCAAPAERFPLVTPNGTATSHSPYCGRHLPRAKLAPAFWRT